MIAGFKVQDKLPDGRPKKHLSIDPKPLDVPDGTCIKEDDTKDVYVFVANRKIWIKIASGYEDEASE